MLSPVRDSYLAELFHVFPQQPTQPEKPATPQLHLVVTNDDGPADLDALGELFRSAIPILSNQEMASLEPEARAGGFLRNLMTGLFGEQGMSIDSGKDRVLVKLAEGTKLPDVKPGLYLFEGREDIARLKEIAGKGGIDLHQALSVDA